jgi:hypothetical protein
MTKIKHIGWLSLAVGLLSVGSWAGWKNYTEHTEPPPGWKLLVNPEGKYALREASGYTIMRDYRASGYGMSRQRAINYAWGVYERDQEMAAFKEEGK